MSLAAEPMKVNLSDLCIASATRPTQLSDPYKMSTTPNRKSCQQDTEGMQGNTVLMQESEPLMQNHHYKHLLALCAFRPPPGLSAPDIVRSRINRCPREIDTGETFGLQQVEYKKESVGSIGSESTAASRCTSRQSIVSQRSIDNRSTVIIKNLVIDCKRERLVNFLNDVGFKGAYDLVYLPLDFTTKEGFYYAFVNFVSAQIALEFESKMSGFRSEKLFGEQCCEISWSDNLQGLEAAVETYRNSPVMHPDVSEECKPMLFMNGHVVPFPAPTKAIRKPRKNRHRK